MKYAIKNKRGTYLFGFHSGSGWKIGDVFACSALNRIVFDTEREAQEKINYILEECEAQRPRWKDWTETALVYARKLYTIEDY